MPKPSFDHHDDTLATVAWSRLAESDDRAARLLLETLGAVGALDWLYSRAELPGDAIPPGVSPTAGLGPGEWAKAVARWLPRLAALDPRRELEVIARRGGYVLLPDDDRWPAALNDLPDPPWCLWVIGSAAPAELCDRAVAIVGSRACTEYGASVCRDLAYELALAGITVVSGGAFGIDAAAHRAALAAGGPTAAVMAGGLDRYYPSANAELIGQVADAGAVIAEVPPGSAPMRSRFLRRNRLIAALAHATVVVEAGWRSGALNTARTAAELLRPVGGIPGPVTSAASAGVHRLIRDGEAVLVTGTDDVLELIGPLNAAGEPEPWVQAGLLDGLGHQASKVLDALPARAGAGLEALARSSGLAVGSVQAALGSLELGGQVVRAGEVWKRAR